MKVALFDVHSYEASHSRLRTSASAHDLMYLEPRMTLETATLAAGQAGVCAFVNDRLDRATLQALRGLGVRPIALRSAGYNHVDLVAAAAGSPCRARP